MAIHRGARLRCSTVGGVAALSPVIAKLEPCVADFDRRAGWKRRTRFIHFGGLGCRVMRATAAETRVGTLGEIAAILISQTACDGPSRAATIDGGEAPAAVDATAFAPVGVQKEGRTSINKRSVDPRHLFASASREKTEGERANANHGVATAVHTPPKPEGAWPGE